MSLRTGWEHHDLLRTMEQCTLADLLNMYKREKTIYSHLCVDYVNRLEELSVEAKRAYEFRCQIHKEATGLIATHIAEMLVADPFNGCT